MRWSYGKFNVRMNAYIREQRGACYQHGPCLTNNIFWTDMKLLQQFLKSNYFHKSTSQMLVLIAKYLDANRGDSKEDKIYKQSHYEFNF